MRNRNRFPGLLCGTAGAACALAVLSAAFQAAPVERTIPNILYILCDDLGYGDVHALNPARGKIATPNLDRLAAQGMTFSDMHSGSSVCTPTRYGILTGRYCWRSHLQTGVLIGDSAPLIAPGRLTVAELLRRNGYATACIGKWHLGMQMPRKAGTGTRKLAENIDYQAPIRQGPTTVGFDYYYGIVASLDMPPFVFVENDRFTTAATVRKRWLREGPAAPDFEAVNVLPVLTRKAVEYIGRQAEASKKGKPFFLYLPLNSPHTPIVPSQEWQGKSGISPYADFVMQTDAAVGELLAALDRFGLADSTIVLFTSDNGCSPAAKVAELEAKGHFPSAEFRGYKSDIWDGGHRVPFLARWPGHVTAGTKTDQPACLTDLLATCAGLVGAALPDNAAEDSVSLLSVLAGTAADPVREAVVHHSIQGKFAIRQGPWKLELCPGSGGWSKPGDKEAEKQGLPTLQLYNMTQDVGERRNLAAEKPELVKKMTVLLEKYVTDGRSTPGAPQKNDVPIDIWKRAGLKKVEPE